MNKYDVGLVILLVIFSFSFFFFLKDEKGNKEAVVYYDDTEILRVNMNKDSLYTVEGLNGEVVIEVSKNRVRIKKETSPNNICSKMGFIESSYETLVCLPNKIVVKINAVSELDAVIN